MRKPGNKIQTSANHMKHSYSGVPRFSVIIPAYNEEAYLCRLLDSVEAARSRFSREADAVEIVVVDNISTDRTADLARMHGCRVVREEKRVIAAVRNAGARAAKGQVFVFVDADNVIHPDTFKAIERCLSTGKVVAGASGVRMERVSLGIAVTYMLMVPMVWLTGMDTGVVFCGREDFEAIGGYDEARLFAEDVQFLWDLRRLGRRRGQKLSRITSVKATFSTRKFDMHGDWHYLGLMALFFYGLLFSPHPMDRLAQTYWYGNQRTNKRGSKSEPDAETCPVK